MDAGLGARVTGDTDRLARTFPRAGVGLGALTADREAAQMADAPIAFNTLEALEVHADFAAKIAFDDIFAVLDCVHDLGKLRFGEVLGADRGIDVCGGKDVFRVIRADAVNIAERDINALVGGNFYSDDASHMGLNGLALALFVTGVGANHTNDAFAFYDFAIFAKLFD